MHCELESQWRHWLPRKELWPGLWHSISPDKIRMMFMTACNTFDQRIGFPRPSSAEPSLPEPVRLTFWRFMADSVLVQHVRLCCKASEDNTECRTIRKRQHRTIAGASCQCAQGKSMMELQCIRRLVALTDCFDMILSLTQND